jgi:hypothetical protein
VGHVRLRGTVENRIIRLTGESIQVVMRNELKMSDLLLRAGYGILFGSVAHNATQCRNTNDNGILNAIM